MSEAYDLFVKMTQIASVAVHKAQEENRRLGIPNVYSINGKTVYEYKGKILTTPPKHWGIQCHSGSSSPSSLG